jgi:hypothetical protein
MKPIDLRVREDTLALTHALCLQRHLERAALLREALDIGLLMLAASGPPAADEPPDTYGTLSSVRLTQLLRPRLPPVLDFLSRYDALPLVALSPPLQPRQAASAGLSVDAAVGDALDAFGISALGDEA